MRSGEGPADPQPAVSPESARDPADACRGDQESARGTCRWLAGLVVAPPGRAESGTAGTVSVRTLPVSGITQGRA